MVDRTMICSAEPSTVDGSLIWFKIALVILHFVVAEYYFVERMASSTHDGGDAANTMVSQFGVTMASQSASSSEWPAQPFSDQENIAPRQENIAEDAMSVNTSVSQPSVEIPRQTAHVPLQVNHVIERREQWLAMNNLPFGHDHE